MHIEFDYSVSVLQTTLRHTPLGSCRPLSIAETPEAARSNWSDYERWFEPVWDRERLNDITKHFATAFLGQNLTTDKSGDKYLSEKLEGFKPRTTIGISLEVGKQ